MTKSTFLATLLVLCLGQASASTITFENIAIANGYSLLANNFDGKGFFPDYQMSAISPYSVIVYGPQYHTQATYASNGTALLDISNTSVYLGKTSSSKHEFSVSSIDMTNAALNKNSTKVTLTGTFADHSTITKSFAYNKDNSLTTTDLFTEQLTGFTNINSLKFSVTGDLVVDNIVIDDATVPEPASIVLVGLGLICFVATRRRRFS